MTRKRYPWSEAHGDGSKRRPKKCGCGCGCGRKSNRRIQCPICKRGAGPGCWWREDAQSCHKCAEAPAMEEDEEEEQTMEEQAKAAAEAWNKAKEKAVTKEWWVVIEKGAGGSPYVSQTPDGGPGAGKKVQEPAAKKMPREKHTKGKR